MNNRRKSCQFNRAYQLGLTSIFAENLLLWCMENGVELLHISREFFNSKCVFDYTIPSTNICSFDNKDGWQETKYLCACSWWLGWDIFSGEKMFHP